LGNSIIEKDFWVLPALLLWTVFFALGIMPEWVYYILRDWGNVVTQRAFVNSYYMITLGLSGYLFFFVQFRCREAGLTFMDALGRSVQIGVLSLLAFIPVPLEELFFLSQIPIPGYRHMLIAVSCAKMLAWFYLLTILFRYYLWNGHEVFLRLISIFPSSYIALKSTNEENLDAVQQAHNVEQEER